MTSLALVRVCNRGMMGSDFSLLLFFKAGVKQRLFLFFPCCSRALSGCSEQGLPRGSQASPGVASLVVEHRLWAHGLQHLQLSGSGLVAHGLSCPAACPESSRTRD